VSISFCFEKSKKIAKKNYQKNQIIKNSNKSNNPKYKKSKSLIKYKNKSKRFEICRPNSEKTIFFVLNLRILKYSQMAVSTNYWALSFQNS
jgi:hypothetical protein